MSRKMILAVGEGIFVYMMEEWWCLFSANAFEVFMVVLGMIGAIWG